jgi:hypothetical protein
MARNFVRLLFASPQINSINREAKSIPVLNPFDRYGRVFFFSWLGFMVAFLSWYAFPPLVSYPNTCVPADIGSNTIKVNKYLTVNSYN